MAKLAKEKKEKEEQAQSQGLGMAPKATRAFAGQQAPVAKQEVVQA